VRFGLATISGHRRGPQDVVGMQECSTLQPDLDERRLHAGHDPLHLALVDVADHAATPAALDVQFLQHAVLDHRHARLARGHVDQDLLAHGRAPIIGTSNRASMRAVSCRGRPMTPEWLPDRWLTKDSATPWIA